MKSNFGIMLRKIRLDNNELLKDMAKKLNISTSYLSAVELGKRNVPDNWIDRIISIYKLSKIKSEKLRKLAEEAKCKVEINLINKSTKKRDVALSFARKFDDLNEEQQDKILRILKKSSKF